MTRTRDVQNKTLLKNKYCKDRKGSRGKTWPKTINTPSCPYLFLTSWSHCGNSLWSFHSAMDVASLEEGRPCLKPFCFVFPTQTSNVFSSQTFLRSVGFRLVLCFLYIWLLWPNLDRHHSRNAWQQQPLDANFERQTKSCSFLRRKSPAKSAEKDRRETKYGLFRN